MFNFFKKDDLSEKIEDLLNVTRFNDDPLSCYKELSDMSESFTSKIFKKGEYLTFFSYRNYAFVVTKEDKGSLFLITFNEPEKFDPKFLEKYNLSPCKDVSPKSPTYIDSDVFPLHFFERYDRHVVPLKVLCHVHEYKYNNGSFPHLKSATFEEFLEYGDGELFKELQNDKHDHFPLCSFRDVIDQRSINRNLSKKIVEVSRKLLKEGLSKS